ncbi:uncharacterized protein LOC129799860 [Phlebotomus papatasi]|uniref:uncharacterized protein LOC129799860 n=1 Tax=Phlebotomus papatasi TaxID=29031 RepID=UPI00248427FC|nr:uncharacterized protein LOC129799860 [Phlebotomus papatasi]
METAGDKYVLYGGEVRENLTKRYKSLGELYAEKLQDSKNEAEIIDAKSGERLSRDYLREASEHLTEFLRRKGIKSGDVMAILSENRLQFPIVLFAAIFSGAPLSVLSPYYTEYEIQFALEIVQPKVIFFTAKVSEKIKIVLKRMNIESILIFLNDEDLKSKEFINYSEILQDETFKPKSGFKVAETDKEKDVAFILQSSGTTGLPKSVQMTHKNVLAGMSSTMDIFKDFHEHKDIVLTVAPWVHNFGLLTMLRLIASGTKMISLQRFEEDFYLKTIERYRASVLFVAPPVMVFLSKSPILDRYNLQTLRVIYSGAAPLSKETVEGIFRRLPSLETICNGYGMTETTIGALFATFFSKKANTNGVLWKGLSAKIIDAETGRALPPNIPGELCIKGDQIMIGYKGNEEATKAAVDRDGWLHTGDIAYYKGNEIFLMGRSKELIKYKGFQVSPSELEAIIVGHPKVRDVAVIGIPDEVAGELPMALVVRKPQASVHEEELQDFVNSRVSGTKKLRGGIRFVDEIPKNVNGKIMRDFLRKKYGSIQKSKL